MNFSKLNKSDQMWLKRLIKNLLINLPGYPLICSGLRYFIPVNRWLIRLPVAQSVVTVRVCEQFIRMTNTHRCEIAKQYFWTRGLRYMPEEQIALEIFERLSQEHCSILDIGSSSGLFSLVGAKSNKNARVFALDILPEAIKILFDNILLNNVTNVYPMLVGVGSKRSFRVPLRIDLASVPSSVSLDDEFEDGIEVSVWEMNELVPLLISKEPDTVLVKIDVESCESEVLDTGVALLDKYRPTVLCEVLTSSHSQNYQHSLRRLGYRFYLITECGLLECEAVRPHVRYKDWIFISGASKSMSIIDYFLAPSC